MRNNGRAKLAIRGGHPPKKSDGGPLTKPIVKGAACRKGRHEYKYCNFLIIL